MSFVTDNTITTTTTTFGIIMLIIIIIILFFDRYDPPSVVLDDSDVSVTESSFIRLLCNGVSSISR